MCKNDWLFDWASSIDRSFIYNNIPEGNGSKHIMHSWSISEVNFSSVGGGVIWDFIKKKNGNACLVVCFQSQERREKKRKREKHCLLLLCALGEGGGTYIADAIGIDNSGQRMLAYSTITSFWAWRCLIYRFQCLSFATKNPKTKQNEKRKQKTKRVTLHVEKTDGETARWLWYLSMLAWLNRASTSNSSSLSVKL